MCSGIVQAQQDCPVNLMCATIYYSKTQDIKFIISNLSTLHSLWVLILHQFVAILQGLVATNWLGNVDMKNNLRAYNMYVWGFLIHFMNTLYNMTMALGLHVCEHLRSQSLEQYRTSRCLKYPHQGFTNRLDKVFLNIYIRCCEASHYPHDSFTYFSLQTTVMWNKLAILPG